MVYFVLQFIFRQLSMGCTGGYRLVKLMQQIEQVASLAQELLEHLGHSRAVGFTVVFGDVEAAIEASDLLPNNEVNSCPTPKEFCIKCVGSN